MPRFPVGWSKIPHQADVLSREAEIPPKLEGKLELGAKARVK